MYQPGIGERADPLANQIQIGSARRSGRTCSERCCMDQGEFHLRPDPCNNALLKRESIGPLYPSVDIFSINRPWSPGVRGCRVRGNVRVLRVGDRWLCARSAACRSYPLGSRTIALLLASSFLQTLAACGSRLDCCSAALPSLTMGAIFLRMRRFDIGSHPRA